jgi:hypothetical protein
MAGIRSATPILMRTLPLLLCLAALALTLPGCRRPYRVGDHVLVEWRGGFHPAVIMAVEGPRFRVHYDGYSDDWEEWVTGVRIQNHLTASASPDLAPSSVRPLPRASASAAASAQPPIGYKVGDRVRVEWHGTIYGATIVAVLGSDRYRVHYDTYGEEWDENIGLNRIQRR